MALMNEAVVDNEDSYELKLHPLDENEYIGSIKIKTGDTADNEKQEFPKCIQTVIILDRSGSMGDAARRVSNEIIPLFLAKLAYKASDVIHFITFDSNTQLYTVTIDSMKSLPIRATGATKMSPAIRKCQELFKTFNKNEPIRVLTISDGKVVDGRETEKAATSFVEFLGGLDFSINSQAVRLFTSASQPDTTALCSLLQINNTTTSQLADISTRERNDPIATKIANLFKADNFSTGLRLKTDENIILKFPWDSTATSQVNLVPGDNLFWLKKAPSTGTKVGKFPVTIVMQEPLTLLKFQELINLRLDYIIDHMKILKVVGSQEANDMVRKMLEYFEIRESFLAAESDLNKAYYMKISKLLAKIANDDNVKKLDSARKAEYLRNPGCAKENQVENNEIHEEVDALEDGEDLPTTTKEDDTIAVSTGRKEITYTVFFLLLAMSVFKYFSE